MQLIILKISCLNKLIRPERITATSCSATELYKKLKEEFLDRLPQPFQLFGEVER
jgi:hypothetical protein